MKSKRTVPSIVTSLGDAEAAVARVLLIQPARTLRRNGTSHQGVVARFV
jgi:hypothetical protein